MKVNEKTRKVYLKVPDYKNPTYTRKLRGNNSEFEYDSGVYVFVNERTEEIYYVGVTINLKSRMNSHQENWRRHSLYKYLYDRHGDIDIVKDKLSEVTVMFWEEDNQYLQNLYEKYFILTLKPSFNVSRYVNGRKQESGRISFEDKVRTIQLLGR